MMDFQSVFFRTDWKSILRRITEIISGQILKNRGHGTDFCRLIWPIELFASGLWALCGDNVTTVVPQNAKSDLTVELSSLRL